MARIDALKPLFVDHQVNTAWAVFWTIVAVAIPTLIRSSVQGAVTGCETITFVPFVVLSAIFLGWRYAAAVALFSAFFADALFLGHGHLLLEGPCDVYGTAMFLFGSGLTIGSVEVIRREFQKTPDTPGPGERTGGIVFSLEDGEAWVSWYGKRSAVRLGTQEEVTEMMQDFIAQVELAKRLRGN